MSFSRRKGADYDVFAEQMLYALGRGPMSTRALAAYVNVSKYKALRILRLVAATGAIHMDGGRGKVTKWRLGPKPGDEPIKPAKTAKKAEAAADAAAADWEGQSSGKWRVKSWLFDEHRKLPKKTERAHGRSSWVGLPASGFTAFMQSRAESMSASREARHVPGLSREAWQD